MAGKTELLHIVNKYSVVFDEAINKLGDGIMDLKVKVGAKHRGGFYDLYKVIGGESDKNLTGQLYTNTLPYH